MYALVLAPAAHAFGVGVAPSTLELDVEPGSVTRQVLRIKNFNPDKAIRLTVSSTDWTLSEDGEVELLPPGSVDRSATPWIRFSPSVLMLKPNASGTVTVDVAVPVTGTERGDYRSAVVVSTVLPAKQDREDLGGVWNRYQIASLFYANVDKGRSKAQISNVAFETAEAQSQRRLQIDLLNQGEAHARVKGQIRLLNTDEEVVFTRPVESVLLDGQQRRLTLDFDQNTLPPGDYTADIALSENGRNLALPDKAPRISIR
ncbi:hypothetical protein Q4485_05290 [Granulosicoccaceae sp. 1_MG-2023]|nr:hypothetical protein [Granulosicoccaceae sp. 1_MG-2023]